MVWLPQDGQTLDLRIGQRLRITGRQQHRQLWIERPHLVRQRDPIHAAGQDDVGEDKIDRRPGGKSRERGRRVLSLRDGVTGILQHLGRKFRDVGIVLDDEYSAHGGCRLGGPVWRPHMRPVIECRKIQEWPDDAIFHARGLMDSALDFRGRKSGEKLKRERAEDGP